MGPTPAPADQTDESLPLEQQRALPTPFLNKTYQMVDDPIVDDVISWNEEGSTFVVWRPAEFARDLLPKYFKHNNFSSFVRQLNTYGFRKIVPDRWEFANDCFRRGEKRMLCDIQRRKISSPVALAVVASTSAPAMQVNRAGSPTNSLEEQGEQVLSSNSSPPPPGSTTELLEENERLRKENRKLANELSKMKNLCNNIFLLMSKYAGAAPQAPEPLDLMPARQESEEAEELGVKAESSPPPPPPSSGAGSSSWYFEPTPMLFGFSIGEKRCREVEDCEDELPAPSLAPAVKSEPFEPDSYQLSLPAAEEAETAAERRPWVVYCPRPQRVCNGKDRVLMESDGAHVS
ncbi:hypothetical protein M5K25_009712 [Dendrobium thyrsiflorum]|uniref:HSF-type DNA-binding domain-containing protein n=1 Tax=Dendrobium thyrsiflorum TaxID=117978 RepID=A0ABD0V5T9_DENTH